MSETETPEDPNKKLELNKETIKELDEEELDQVAGGALGTGGGKCKAQTLAPACPPAESDLCPIPTVGCSPEPDPPTIVGVTCPLEE